MDDVSLGAGAVWTDIDLSAECPNAIGVIIMVEETGAAAQDYGLQHNDSTDDRVHPICLSGNQWAIVGCDSNQVIEGYIGAAVSVDFYVAGYFTEASGFSFETNGVDYSLAGDLQHTTLMAKNSAGLAEYIGYAPPGSDNYQSDNRWLIKKLEYDSDNFNTKAVFAGGSNAYDKSWTSRASYDYS